jgi:DNA-binding NarL/FixJ family response regulator
VLKGAGAADLIAAVRGVARGDTLVSRDATLRLIAEFVRPVAGGRAPSPGLTNRERKVLQLVARGNSDVEIARAIVVPPGTVAADLAQVRAKLGLRDRVHAVIHVHERGAP